VGKVAEEKVKKVVEGEEVSWESARDPRGALG